MKIVVTQPTFLPWLGYLAQMASCDIFVCLDSVQFARRSWQSRNRIVSRLGKVEYLSVSVKKGSRADAISRTIISDNYDPRSLYQLISSYYRGCPESEAGSLHCEPLYSDYHRPGVSLALANTEQLRIIAKLMGLKTKIVRSSELDGELVWDTPTERLLAISQSLGATEYLSSVGSRPYMLNELEKFKKAGIDVRWQQFEHISYVEHAPFVSHLSCVDFLHHKPIGALLPYVLDCNRFVSEAEYRCTEPH